MLFLTSVILSPYLKKKSLSFIQLFFYYGIIFKAFLIFNLSYREGASFFVEISVTIQIVQTYYTCELLIFFIIPGFFNS